MLVRLLAACLSIALLALWLTRRSWRQRRYPPGPQGLPIVGSFFDIDNERPWITYNKWARQYGDIVMYWVMGRPVILLGKMDHALGLLQKRMVNYSDRPELVVAQDFVTQNGWYIGTSRTKHGTHKKQRKILAERLRAAALKEWAHPAVLPEMHLFLQRLIQAPDRFVSIIKCFTVNVMLNSTFAHGSISNLDHPLITRINAATDHQFEAQVQGRYWVDYLPALKHLPTWVPGMGWKKRALQWRKQVNALYLELWETTKARTDAEKTKYPCLVQNLIETQMDNISLLEGTTISSAMVDAGTDTLTATTVTFIIIFMYFPGLLKKAQEIVDETVGRHRVPTFDDISRMPYIIAMIREAFRWRTVAPVAIPHAAVEDDVYAGYFIPKGATVFALSHYIHRDEELYPDPESFKPERFLDEYGQLNSLPHAGFGFGSRKCLGQHFAEETLFLVISSLVWAFDISPPLDDKGRKILPSLDPKDWGAFLASPPPMDFHVVIKPRSQAAIDIVNRAVEEDKAD